MRPFLGQMVVKASKVISSKSLTYYLVGGGVFYYILLEIWSSEVLARISADIRGNRIFQFFYILLLVNLFIRVIKTILYLFFKENFFPWESFKFFLLKGSIGLISLFLILLGILLSENTRQATQSYLKEGDTYFSDDLKFSFLINRIKIIDQKGNRPMPQKAVAIIKYPLENFKNTASLKIFPPRKINDLYLQLTNYGLAPGFLLRNNRSYIVHQGFMMLEILPPGLIDYIQLPRVPYLFQIALHTNQVDGEDMIPLSDIMQYPRYELKIFQGKRLYFEGIVSPGQQIAFPGYTISFQDIRPWVGINIIKDKGLFMVTVGLFLAVQAILLKIISTFFFYRKSVGQECPAYQ